MKLGKLAIQGLILSILSLTFLYPAEAAKWRILERPEDLSMYDKNYGLQPVLKRRNIPWIVFADRSGMPVYHDQTCTRLSINARFMQSFFVAGVGKDKKALYLVNAKLDRRLEKSRIIRKYGWAKTDQLLLTDLAVKHPETSIYRKAIVVTDFSIFSKEDSVEKLQIGQAKLYTARNEQSNVVRTIGLQEFGFVYKQVSSGGHTWYFIGKRHKYYGLDISDKWQNEKKEFGWITDARVQIWDTREAFEPLPERSKPVHIYETGPALVREDEDKILFRDNLKREKWKMSRFRYPLTSDGFFRRGTYPGQTYAMARIGFLSRLIYFGENLPEPEYGQENSKRGELSPNQAAYLKEAAERLRSNLQILNIVFVIDATESMRPHLRKAADVAMEFIADSKYLMSEGAKLIKFGAVIYRDQYDGDGMCDYKPLTSKVQDLKRWLYTVKPPINRNDPDFKEALFVGLDKAVSVVIKGAKGNNVIIVIGDAGDNGRSKLSHAILAKKIGEKSELHAKRIVYPAKNEAQKAANNKFKTDLQTIISLISFQEIRFLHETLGIPFQDWNSYQEVLHTEDAKQTSKRWVYPSFPKDLVPEMITFCDFSCQGIRTSEYMCFYEAVE